MAGCGAELDANKLITDLTQDATFPIPNIDLSGDDFKFPADILNKTPEPLKLEDLTTATLDGPGAFDTLMRGFKAHLQEEWDRGRITGDDYTKAYISLAESAMSQGLAFIMGKDGAYWQSVSTAVQAYTARVALETAKATLAAQQYDAANQKAGYALTKLKLSNESVAYCTAQYNLASILPQQLATMVVEKTGKELVNAGQTTENSIASFNLQQLLPLQRAALERQNSGQEIANDTATYNLQQMLPAQLATVQKQQLMIEEQTNAQRAQTTDNRMDATPITGVLGKQKELYSQQITSYQRDSELKVAKVFSDAWITQKTIDEGLVPPTSFTNTEIEKVLSQLRTKANIGV